MKKKVVIIGLVAVLVIILLTIIIVSCSRNNNVIITNDGKMINKVDPNTDIDSLGLFIPEGFEYRPDLRGTIYTEEDKKVYVKGNSNDYSDCVVINILMEFLEGGEMTEYIESLNENVDVKYEMQSNKSIDNIYVRNNYKLTENGYSRVGYTYIIEKDGELYTIHVKGPETKSEEVTEIANELFGSLQLIK